MPDQTQLPLPTPGTWTRPKGKRACGRNPAKGPGTCHFWWEGCPNPEKRGCYQLWRERQAEKAEERA